MRARHLLALASSLLALAVAPVRADQILGPGRVVTGTNAVVLPGGPTLGRWENGKYTSTPDAIQVRGSGSTGDVSGTSVQTAPSVQRSLLSIVADLPATIASVGGACDGSSLIDQFWTALASDPRTLVVPSGANCRVASSMTLPKGRNLRIEGSGRITVDAGKVFTARLALDAPLRQVFFGAGSVVGLKVSRPEWWGAQNTYGWATGRDDAPAFNAAMASAAASFAPDGTSSDGDRPSIRFHGIYYACSQIDLYPTQTINLGFYGSGTLNGGGTIRTCPTFDTAGGTRPALLAVHGANIASFGGTDLDFRDFNLSNTVGSGAQIGMSWVPEGAGYALAGGLEHGYVGNVAVTDFPTGIKYQNTRLVRFDRASAWGSNKSTTLGLWITSSDNQRFTGDTDFVNFKAALCGSSSSNALCAGITNIRISADGAVGAGAQLSERIKGLRFLLDLANAEKAIDVQALNGAQIGDMWVLPGTQVDGLACNTISLASGNASGNTSGSLIDDVHIVGTYNRGRNAGCPAIAAAGTGSSTIRSLFITGNWFANAAANVVNVFNVHGLHLDGNTVYDPLGAVQDAAFSLSAATGFTANNNVLTRSGGGNTFANLFNLGAGSDYGTVVNNVCEAGAATSGCVANNAAGTHLVVTPNVGP